MFNSFQFTPRIKSQIETLKQKQNRILKKKKL